MSTSRTYTLTSDELQYLLNEAIVCYNARCGRAPATCTQILTVSQLLDDLDAPKLSSEPEDLPDDFPGEDDPDRGPQACAMPCDFPASHAVTTAANTTLLLCTRHAAVHNPSRVTPLRTRIDEMLESVCTGCDAGWGAVCICGYEVAA